MIEIYCCITLVISLKIKWNEEGGEKTQMKRMEQE
jgi:hypothetical protein